MSSEANMVFIQRGDDGQIVDVTLNPRPGFVRCLAVDEFELSGLSDKFSKQITSLAASDLAMARVLEDLIDLLIKREVIRFTDLPQGAQHKLLSRRSIRAEMQGLDLLDDDLDEVL